jgi:hypothetical protein
LQDAREFLPVVDEIGGRQPFRQMNLSAENAFALRYKAIRLRPDYSLKVE